MATFKMQRARGDFGRVPVKVLEALVQSSRETLGAAYRRLDYCYSLAPGGGRPFADSVRRYLVGEGLTPAEVETVTEHVCGPRKNPTATTFKPVAERRKNPTGFKRWTIYLFPTPEQDARAGQIVKRWDGRLKVNTATFKNADDAQHARHQLGEWGIEMLRQNPASRVLRAKKRNPADAKAVSAIILAQLGGAGRVSAMLGRPTMGYGTSPEGPYLSIKFASPHRGPNWCKITLTPADTYTVEFGKVVKYDVKPAGTYTDVYAEQLKPLFERVTGLYLSLGTMGRR